MESVNSSNFDMDRCRNATISEYVPISMFVGRAVVRFFVAIDEWFVFIFLSLRLARETQHRRDMAKRLGNGNAHAQLNSGGNAHRDAISYADGFRY